MMIDIVDIMVHMANSLKKIVVVVGMHKLMKRSIGNIISFVMETSKSQHYQMVRHNNALKMCLAGKVTSKLK